MRGPRSGVPRYCACPRRSRERWRSGGPSWCASGASPPWACSGIFLTLQFLIPARLVISGMGAAGRPSVAVGLLLAFMWILSALRPHELPRGRQPVRWLVALFVATQLLGYVVGFDRVPSEVEASSADRWLIFVVSMAGLTLAVADGIRTRAAWTGCCG